MGLDVGKLPRYAWRRRCFTLLSFFLCLSVRFLCVSVSSKRGFAALYLLCILIARSDSPRRSLIGHYDNHIIHNIKYMQPIPTCAFVGCAFFLNPNGSE
jgi:hypothetical protein